MTWLLDNWHKFVLCLVLICGYAIGANIVTMERQTQKTEQALKQLADSSAYHEQRQSHFLSNEIYAAGWLVVSLLIFLIFLGDFRRMLKHLMVVGLIIACTGCRKPFEPVKLQVIHPNEEAFLLPYTGDGKKQTSSDSEDYLKANLIYTKQIQIPQQWVQKGYETFGWNGDWQDAAILVKVDKSPSTREWTADPNSGTSNKNEAIWVMTSDQVEFSTGWTCTARISSRDDAVKFLFNYPNGSLIKVLDTEVRSKLQAEFGLEVTDLPMEELRKTATPHIVKVVKNVTEFFKGRGITITNLGISGGFIYKDKTILDTMVRVFNAEQEKSIAVAESNAQQERNKKVISKAHGEAEALLSLKKAEADSVRMQVDAKSYEMEKAKDNLHSYIQLKQLELQKELLHKWDGSYPRYFMGAGGSPNMLLQLPALEPAEKKK